MNVTPDDPALTAYALGELSEPEAAKVAKAIAHDETLAEEAETLGDLAALLGSTLGGEQFSLGEGRREEIFKAGHRPDADVLVFDHKKRARRQSVLAIAGVAAVVVAGFMGLSQLGADGPAGKASGGSMADGDGGQGTSSDIADVSAAGAGASETLTALITAPILPEADPVLPLVMNPGFVDLAAYEKALGSKQRPIAAEFFATEAWVNLVRLHSAPQVALGKVGVSAELGACPWDEGKLLLMVNLDLDGEGAVRFDGRLNLNPERVKSARILATAREGERERLLRGSQTTVYELEMIEGDEAIGSLAFETTGEVNDGNLEKGYLPLTTPAESATAAFQATSTFATFARWGGSDQNDAVALKALAKNAAELLPQISDEQARYALDLILLTAERIGE